MKNRWHSGVSCLCWVMVWRWISVFSKNQNDGIRRMISSLFMHGTKKTQFIKMPNVDLSRILSWRLNARTGIRGISANGWWCYLVVAYVLRAATTCERFTKSLMANSSLSKQVEVQWKQQSFSFLLYQQELYWIWSLWAWLDNSCLIWWATSSCRAAYWPNALIEFVVRDLLFATYPKFSSFKL